MAFLDLEKTEEALSWEGILCYDLNWTNNDPASAKGELVTPNGSLFSDNTDTLDGSAQGLHIRAVANTYVS